MDLTPNLGLPYIMAAQSQKHVTHNEAIRALDALLQLSVLDRNLNVPPDSPAEGARYIVAASPTGAWSGHAHEVAARQDGAWMFYAPIEGWITWVSDEDVAVVWTGSAWSALTTGEGGGGGGDPDPDPEFDTVAINGAAADTTNRLSLNAPATLFSHDGDDHRLKINKASASDIASLLYQDAFSGRAEIGLTGDDDFHFKVSADGSTWKEAIVIDRTTGAVELPFTEALAAGARRNRWINGACQISQRNGNSSGTSDGYYPIDRLRVRFVTSAGVITSQRVQSVTPGGAKDRVRITITTADASLAAGEYLYAHTCLEGQDVVDFRWGSGSAKSAVLRFLFKGPAGTYAVRLSNSASDRSYVALFSPAAANTDEIITISIPGDTSGTWPTDTSIGMDVCVVLACGATFQGAAGWQAGNILGTSAVSNGMATGSAAFELGEIGFYLDPGATGIAPAWELPDPAAELAACMRYWERTVIVHSSSPPSTYSAVSWKAQKRVAPTLTVTQINGAGPPMILPDVGGGLDLVYQASTATSLGSIYVDGDAEVF